jgi:hypothetical protein
MLTLRQYKAGETILRQDEPGETAFIIERGQVEVLKTLADGQQVHLAFLSTGETFGEMSMIDDKPRSATVSAVEETVIREIHRDAFFQSLQTDPDIGVNLLKVLFERLREAHATIAQLQTDRPESFPPPVSPAAPGQPPVHVFIEGATPRAVAVLPSNPLPITKFPFRIGRQSRDLLAHNDLTIPDTAPLQISRHHVALIKHADRIGIVDRGSTLGALVDDQQLGGPQGNPGPIFFSGAVTRLILGNPHSPFQYQISLETNDEVST